MTVAIAAATTIAMWSLIIWNWTRPPPPPPPPPKPRGQTRQLIDEIDRQVVIAAYLYVAITYVAPGLLALWLIW